MSNPFFSVIIPSYNRSSLLREALDSVFSQTFTDYEVIVVDDGSTDNTLEILKNYGDKIKVLQQRNSGPGAARNHGAKEAKGEFLTFIDSDDIWFPWTLKILHDVILEKKCSWIAGSIMRFTGEKIDITKYDKPLEITKYTDYLSASKIPYWIGCGATAFNRTSFIDAGCFNDGKINAEDSDLWLRLGCLREFIFIKNPVILGYRRTPCSLVADLKKTFLGVRMLIANEKCGAYPGGRDRMIDRIRIITRHVRPISIALAKDGKLKWAIDLYIASLLWNILLVRVIYIIGFPVILAGVFLLGNRKKCGKNHF